MGAEIAGKEVSQQPARSPRHNIPRKHSPRKAAAVTRNIQREGDARNNAAHTLVDRA
jgi:hypothetical protein